MDKNSPQAIYDFLIKKHRIILKISQLAFDFKSSGINVRASFNRIPFG